MKEVEDLSESLNPDVKKFKRFVKEHPRVLRDVHSEEKTLQDLFEEWMLFGEDDEIWDSYKSDEDDELKEKKDKHSKGKADNESKDDTKTEVELLNMLKKMNLNDVQHHLAQFSTVVGSVQELLGQFKQQQIQNPDQPSQEQPPTPFSFRED